MAYTLLGLRSSVRRKLKDTAYSADIIDEAINDTIAEIALLYPWKYFQKVVSGALTVGEHTYEQQSDHQTTTQLIIIHPTTVTSNWNITECRMIATEFFDIYPAPENLDNSQPQYWTEYGDQIYFDCPADLAYTLKQYYQKVPTELTADADIPELPAIFKEDIVLGAAFRCEEERGNYDIAAVLENRFRDKIGDKMLMFSNDTMSGPDTVIMPGRNYHEIYR